MAVERAWREQRIYVASTFLDMQAERDYLRDWVFPRLQELLWLRRTHVVPVDLRWGVQTSHLGQSDGEEAADRKAHVVLRVCFEDIDRCRPYFVLLVGGRYGWIPPRDTLHRIALEKSFEPPQDLASVTELEFIYATAPNPGAAGTRVFAYLRQDLPYAEMPMISALLYSDAYAADSGNVTEARYAVGKLQAFRKMLNAPTPNVFTREYAAVWDSIGQRVTSLDAWGDAVFQDLWTQLAQDIPEHDTMLDVLWPDRGDTETVIAQHADTFVGRSSELDRITQLTCGQTEDALDLNHLIVTGAPGSGKSALLASLARRLQQKVADGSLILLHHVAGLGPRSSALRPILVRWCRMLADAPDLIGTVSSELPEGLAELRAELTRRLRIASSARRVVILVDGLDELERSDAARLVTWLPAELGAHTLLIAGIGPGIELESLLSRDRAVTLEIGPLNDNDAEQIVASTCERYCKVLDATVMRELVEKYRSPLALGVVLGRLVSLEEPDFVEAHRIDALPDQQIVQYMLARSFFAGSTLSAHKVCTKPWR